MLGNGGRNPGFIALYVLQQHYVIAAVVRRPTHNKLVQNGAHTPKICFGIILLRLEDLGRHV